MARFLHLFRGLPGGVALGALTTAAVLLALGCLSPTRDAAAAQDDTKPDNRKAPALVDDLFHDDAGYVDLGDVQMLVGAALALVVFALQVAGFLAQLPLAASTLPDVDSTLLATFGLGQAAYLTKKVVGGPEK